MSVVEIEVAYVNPPKPGKKMGSIKDKAGTYYYAYPNILEQFSSGMKCQIEFDSKTMDDGKEFRTLKKLLGGSLAPKQAPQNFRQRSNPAEAKQIAVLAIVKEWVPQIGVGDEAALIHAIKAAMSAYDKTLGGVVAQRRDDMDDEIGF